MVRYSGVDHYKKRVNKRKVFKDLIFIYIIAVLFVLLVNSILVQAYRVPTGSMEPQISEKTLVLTNKFIFGPRYPFSEKRIFDGTSNIRRGDVVVFMSEEYFRRSKFFRVVSKLVFTITFSLVDISRLIDHYESNLYIKRVIGIPGDIISFKVEDNRSVVYINGVPEKTRIDINYNLIDRNEKNSHLLSEFTLKSEFEVPPGFFYVLGDNRVDSADSRIWGAVSQKQIIGKAFLKYWPFDQIGVIQ
jgi:signal peptidase I